MKSIPHERPGDVVPRRASPRFYYPLATIKCSGSPFFRSQDSRDLACLLDVDPDVARWSCEGVDQIRASVDLLVELKPPTIALMKGVFQWRHKAAITDKQAEIFLLLDDDMKRAIARPGRNVGRMLAQLVMRPRDREPQPRPRPVEPTNDDFEYSLQSMPGYGEAKDWGLQLSISNEAFKTSEGRRGVI
ncbi:hypothetical protein ACU8OK_25605 (plasmid) [Rhizobium leguminosarum]